MAISDERYRRFRNPGKAHRATDVAPHDGRAANGRVRSWDGAASSRIHAACSRKRTSGPRLASYRMGHKSRADLDEGSAVIGELARSTSQAAGRATDVGATTVR